MHTCTSLLAVAPTSAEPLHEYSAVGVPFTTVTLPVITAWLSYGMSGDSMARSGVVEMICQWAKSLEMMWYLVDAGMHTVVK